MKEPRVRFEWSDKKNIINQNKHGLSFLVAQAAFADPKRVVLEDLKHGKEEQRYYCLGEVDGEILTVRFTYRGNVIRIFGAGYWRKGKKLYEKENQIQ